MIEWRGGGGMDRPIARFWFLETVARMPYFSYISMLHLYETLGWWSVGYEVRKVSTAGGGGDATAAKARRQSSHKGSPLGDLGVRPSS
jgi:hypothetical protein